MVGGAGLVGVLLLGGDLASGLLCLVRRVFRASRCVGLRGRLGRSVRWEPWLGTGGWGGFSEPTQTCCAGYLGAGLGWSRDICI